MDHSGLLRRTVFVSVLAHLLLILLLPGLAEVPRAREQRIQVTLNGVRESGTFTEPPESAQVDEPPPDAVNPALFAARAQNPEPAPEVDRTPRSIGDVAMFDFRPIDLLNARARSKVGGGVPAATPSTESSRETQGIEPSAAGDVRLKGEKKSSPGVARPGDRQPGAAGDGHDAGRRRPRHHSPVSGVSTNGALSLSTYAWEYAPYMEYLKELISSHWKPPLAFYMGLVEGEGSVRFRIMRDGRLAASDLIAGDRALDNGAALNAVDNSAPFKVLPDSFPDPYLEVTWTYMYIQLRR